jgi:hypothetical protein
MASQSPKKRKAVVTRERNVRTYAELWHASQSILDAGIRAPKGSSWQFLSSLVLTAFSFEAYLNHVGPAVLSSWERLERLSPEAKLDLLCEVLEVQLPGGPAKRPQQTIIKLFKFRNTLAHGRTETIMAAPKRIDADKVDDHFKRRLLADWEELIKNSSFAKRAREDVKVIVNLIHAARPEPKEYPFTFGLGFGSAEVENV